ncbi:MAG: hypothetical protein PHO40_05520, partial [Candidatus Omnitrophica bacterium]|nr:hypothetical protein [Candidatus Omnitrophota bacterium]
AKTISQTEDALKELNQELDALTKKENAKEMEKIKELMQQAAEAKKMLLEDSTISDEQRDQIEKLMDKMSAAKTISQTEDALKELNQELDALTKKENAKEMEKIKELMQQAAEEKKIFVIEKEGYDLRSKVEDLKNALPQQAALLEDNLDQIRQSKTKEDLSKSASALKELSESEQFEKGFEINESLEVSQGLEQQERFKIDLLPGYIVLPLKSSFPLKNIAVYDNFIKDVSSELEWSSSNPAVAFVDQLGVVYANKNIGFADITCYYRGKVSRKCRVAVVAAISESDKVLIEQELGI